MKKIFSWKSDSKTSGFIAHHEKSPQCTHSLPLPIFGRPNHQKSLLFAINYFARKEAFRWKRELVSFARISIGFCPILCTFNGNFWRVPYHVMAIESNRAKDSSNQTAREHHKSSENEYLVILIARRKLKSMKNWKLHVITVCVGRVFRRIHFFRLWINIESADAHSQERLNWFGIVFLPFSQNNLNLNLVQFIWWLQRSIDLCLCRANAITVNFDEIETIR